MRFPAMSKSPERATLNFSGPGFSGSGGQIVGAAAKEAAAAEKNNFLVEQATTLLQFLPEGLRNDYSRAMADGVVSVQDFVGNKEIQ